MNDNGRNDFNNSNDIDLVDFSGNREMDRIRENERIERERRRKRAAEIRRREIIKRKKMERMKQTAIAWGMLIMVVLVGVAVIVGIASLFSKDEEPELPEVGNYVSEQETATVDAFETFENTVYGEGIYAELNGVSKDVVSGALTAESTVTDLSNLALYAKTYFWNKGFEGSDMIRQTVRDCPMYSNGYIWSSKDGMKSPKSNSYLYDTNASFITAVAEICRWEGDTSFLDALDTTSAQNKDVSGGMTVMQKLTKAKDYFFDTDDINGGGIRYNAEDNLVYVLTSENDGTSSGKPSNIFTNYRFGYLDAYNNLAFYEAMVNLSEIYTMLNDTENAKKYADIAAANKTAFNNTFYSSASSRYIGCIDENKNTYDNGFTAINLYAVSLGVADGERAEKIMSWLDGKSVSSTDSPLENGIYPTLNTPVFNTVSATDAWWDYGDGYHLLSDSASFGKYWMNGSGSYLCGYFDMLARKKTDKNALKNRVTNLGNSYGKGNFALPVDSAVSQPAIHHSASASLAVKEMFGVDTDSDVLTVNPIISSTDVAGIKNISFGRNEYHVLFENDGVYVLSDYEAAVKMNVGSFAKNAKVKVTLVKDNVVVTEEEITADKNGVVSLMNRFGGNSYIKLEPVSEKSKK